MLTANITIIILSNRFRYANIYRNLFIILDMNFNYKLEGLRNAL